MFSALVGDYCANEHKVRRPSSRPRRRPHGVSRGKARCCHHPNCPPESTALRATVTHKHQVLYGLEIGPSVAFSALVGSSPLLVSSISSCFPPPVELSSLVYSHPECEPSVESRVPGALTVSSSPASLPQFLYLPAWVLWVPPYTPQSCPLLHPPDACLAPRGRQH